MAVQPGSPASPESGATTPAARDLRTPLREFLRTETGSAVILLAAVVAALIWANAGAGAYATVWSTEASVHLGQAQVALDLRGWVNSGLMTFFFLVVGFEARREFDVGELRERTRLTLPLAAGLGGTLLPVALFLALNAGRSSVHGWGAAMSTDTAFALGVLALVGRRLPGRVRTYLLSLSVADDLIGICVIALAYSGSIRSVPLAVGLVLLAAVAALRQRGVRYGPLYLALGVAAWVAVLKSGIDPVSVGLVIGLLSYARPATRSDLERASDLFRLFREQPTAELARSAREGVKVAISPNERLEQIFHPWTSYLIVPLFALANAGVTLSASFLADAYTSRITLGIMLAYVVGKPLGTVGAARLATWLGRGRVQPLVGPAGALGSGAVAGIGFTVSLLIASLAFQGTGLEEAKIGVLSAGVCSSLVAWLVFRVTALLPKTRRYLALAGDAQFITDLAVPVNPHRDHVRGPAKAPVTIVEYGDFECPYCGQAEPVVRELLADMAEVRYVWRHLPLTDVHPHALLAAEAAEAAADQDAFWPMHDLLLDHQGALTLRDLLGYANDLGLDADAFVEYLRAQSAAERIDHDVESADLSGVSGTPTFFINGRRHYGAYDINTLTKAVKAALARSAAEHRRRPGGEAPGDRTAQSG
jgi:Na+/H+ antiporter NhaA